MLRGLVSTVAGSRLLTGMLRLRPQCLGAQAPLARRYSGSHEPKIGKLLKDGTALAPACYGGRMLVVIAFTNRSGSNLTANLMAKSRLTTPAREMLNAESVRRSGAEAGRSSAQAYMDWLTTIDKIDAPFALKASFDQLAMLVRWGAREAFGDMRVVHVVREDILSQAISFSIAEQTQRWMSSQEGLNVEPIFDPTDILRRMNGVAVANARIVEVCQIVGLPRLRVSYEEVVADPLRQLGRIAVFLGRDLALGDAPRPDLHKQSDALNAAFREQFRAWARCTGKLAALRSGNA